MTSVTTTSMSSPDWGLPGFNWSNIANPVPIAELDKAFVSFLSNKHADLHKQIIDYREHGIEDAKARSNFLIDLSTALEGFISYLFGIEEAVEEAKLTAEALLPIFRFKKEIIQKRVKRRRKDAAELVSKFEQLDQDLQAIVSSFEIDPAAPLEVQLAEFACNLLDDEEKLADELNLLTEWCVAAKAHPQVAPMLDHWLSFKGVEKLDYNHLVDCESFDFHGVKAYQAPKDALRQRDGFSLTDEGIGPVLAMDEAQYCVYCHKSGTDYCSKGFLLKKTDPSLGYKTDPHGGLLLGCPLEEKISEMNWLYHIGQIIAPLAMVMLDNPMCPATGHRICNDCMKACIYQKQKPVNIPAVETDVLKRVLALPWGVEIYYLLSQWSPLSQSDYLPKAFNHKKVLVMGMGPAGFTLSYYLLRAGYAVAGMDGLKITQLDKRHIDQPILDYQTLVQDLDDRQVTGFGGVAEYGITSRWDKNFLALIYVTLQRQHYFQLYGSVRFGGTMTIERAWSLGFDHLAIAVGAGLPKELPIENSMVNGMRQANDFLMALQLTGAGHFDSLANLQVRLPAVVIGGGLTGVDAATELQAYYIRLIEKIAHRYAVLSGENSAETLRSHFSKHDLIVLDEYLQHAKQLTQERALAEKENRQPNVIKLIHKWGGVSIVYRKAMQQSPAYRLNSEELNCAMQEGIYYVPHMQPTKVITDELGDAKSLQCQSTEDGEQVVLPARTLLVATGAKPNVAYAFEHRDSIKREGFVYARFEAIDNKFKQVEEQRNCKSKDVAMFTSYVRDEKRVSFLGDTHPTFQGSVVKAIASGKRSFESIDHILGQQFSDEQIDYSQFKDRLEKQFNTYVIANKQIKDNLYELTVHAPEARKHYAPGVMYKLQTYDMATSEHSNPLQQSSESVALTAAIIDDQPDQLRFLFEVKGTSTALLSRLQSGDQLVVMGPTGVRANIPSQETVFIVGGLLAIAQLQSLLPALKAAGNTVYYFGCFEHEKNVVHLSDVLDVCDAATISVSDQWSEHTKSLQKFIENCEQSPGMDAAVQMRIVGSSQLLDWVKSQRRDWLNAMLPKHTQWIGSVYGPMQCMLKGVCAQCLQWQIDPETGKRTKAVYACSWQDQPFDKIDISNIQERLSQNHMQEKLSMQWLEYLEHQEK